MNKKSLKDSSFYKNSRIIAMCLKTDIMSSIIMLVMTIAIGPLAALAVKYTGLTIDESIAYIAGEGSNMLLSVLLKAASIAAASAICSIISNYFKIKLKCSSEKAIKEEVLSTAEKVDYLTFISKEHQESFTLAQQELGYHVTLLLYGILDVIRIVFSVGSFIVLLGSFGSTIALISSVIVIALSIFIAAKSNGERLKQVLTNNENERRLLMLTSYYYERSYAAEMTLFGSKSYIDKLYSEYSDELIKNKTELLDKINKRNIVNSGITGIVSALAIILVVFRGNIESVGSITVIINAILAISKASANIGRGFATVNMATLTIGMLTSYKEKYALKDLDIRKTSNDSSAAIEVHNLEFSFGNQKVLDGIDLTIDKGETVAFVGVNGAGKTTLANLILGLYPCKQGTIHVFGNDPFAVRNSDEALASAIQQQFGKYYGLTLEDNIGFGNTINQEKLSEFDNFFSTIDYKNIAGNEYGGVELSGGEWQKIAIARSLNSNSELVLLDEPTAALDPMSEARIFGNIMNQLHDKTCILITHRLGAIRHANRIFLLQNGKIAEEGSHDVLMQKHGAYYEMFTAQAQWYINLNNESEDEVKC